ncbi:Hypothetical predicted protein [Drosophila guanche]|uniref:Secreted protein n=1 Tax=Drosophila guanche TaxID=7266 RepID=A0A3B0JWE4_DROGU|nr:Hypothetical predicted protein [Drosophila guanche]
MPHPSLFLLGVCAPNFAAGHCGTERNGTDIELELQLELEDAAWLKMKMKTKMKMELKLQLELGDVDGDVRCSGLLVW